MPRPTVNKMGKRFGMLLVISKVAGKGRTKWNCQCDCGNTAIVNDDRLGKKTNSCRCLVRANLEAAIRTRIKHGHCRKGKLTPEYISWRGAIQRCTNEKSREWEHYGGRGIKVCEHWRNSFEQFLKDMGARPDGLTLDRRDNDKGYLCPLCFPPRGNCHWVTCSDQLKNQRHEFFHDKRSKRMTNWLMNQSREYRHERAVSAARARWGN